MRATIIPKPLTKRTVRIPTSKSLGHRAIICASLAQGRSIIRGVDHSIDIDATIDCMRTWGAVIEAQGSDLIIDGTAYPKTQDRVAIDCHESGSTLRFLIPVFSRCGHAVHISGAKRLLQRPMQIYQAIYHRQGLHWQQDETHIETAGRLEAGEYVLDGSVSSQFVSGLLFALPLLDGNSIIRIVPPFASKPYVGLTLDMLHRFGIHVEWQDENTLFVPGHQQYQPCECTLDADDSQAAFFAVWAAVAGPLHLDGVREDSRQSDHAIFDILRRMGADVMYDTTGVTVSPADSLQATVMDLEACPDLGPIVFVLASFAEGTSHMIHAGRLRIKESDRIAAMEEELRKFGISIRSTQDEVWVEHAEHGIVPATVLGHNDHRIVMALAILAIASEQVITIEGAQAIRKSYPRFFEDVRALGVNVIMEEEE